MRHFEFSFQKDCEEHMRIFVETRNVNIVHKGLSLLSRAAIYGDVEFAKKTVGCPSYQCQSTLRRESATTK